MPYLTKTEYEKYHYEVVSEDDFNKLESRAADILDGITGNFYQMTNIDEDKNLFRVKQFKKAVAKEIEYMQITKLTGSADVQSQPASQSIGSTSISTSNRNAVGDNSGRLSKVVADELYLILGETGLLYRGVDYV